MQAPGYLSACIENLSHIYQSAKSDLYQLDHPKELADLSTTLSDNINACKSLIKEIKHHDTSNPPELQLLKAKKYELREVQQKVNAQVVMLENRHHFYGSYDLPENLSFAEKLKELKKQFPEFKERLTHLKKIVSIHMRLQKGAITSDDFLRLMEFQDLAAQQSPELTKFIADEIQVIHQAITNKKILLLGLANQLNCLDIPFEHWQISKKLHFYAHVQQFCFNPFEPPIDLSSLFNEQELEDKNTRTLLSLIMQENQPENVKADFWDFLPPLEKKARTLAHTTNTKQMLIALKQDGLKRIIKRHPLSNSNVLIIGGGPAGLMRALSLTMMGHAFTVLEQRSSERQNRTNVITLSKNDPKDSELLLFFGILNIWDRDQNPSFGHLKPHLLEVKISDVETALKDTLAELGMLKHVLFSHKVSELRREDGRAMATIEDLNNPLDKKIMSPSLIIVTEGASSQTRTKLGITKTTLADTTQIIYSTFKEHTQPIPQTEYKTNNLIKGIKTGLIAALATPFCQFKFEKALGNTISGGPTAIFRIPEQDYLIRCLRKPEQEQVDQYKNQINALKEKIEWYQQKNRHSPSMKRTAKIEEMITEMQELEKEKEEFLTGRAQSMHGMMDVLSRLYSKNHEIRQMEVDKNYTVDILVGKAQRSFVQIGATPVILRGDSSHTTDPYSGYGCKTALEETLADQYLFSFMNTDDINPLQYACLNYGHEYYSNSMINQGLRERSLYRRNTELPERYVDLAIRRRVLTEEQLKYFMYLNKKIQNGLPLENSEQAYLVDLESTLQEKLSAKNVDVYTIDAHWEHKLTPILRRSLGNFINGKRGFIRMWRMGMIAPTMAYEDAKEAPLIGLLYIIEQMKIACGISSSPLQILQNLGPCSSSMS